MASKNILIITPYFAPQSHAAVFRAYKLAKYLPENGWNVHILTVDKNYLYNEDPRLLTDLPKSVKIHKAKYTEPTVRGLRMALGGKDRSFKVVKSAMPATQPTISRPSFAKRVYDYLRNRFNSPDPYWTWKYPAISKGLEIIKNHKIDLIMTSSLTFTTLEIAHCLKKKTGVKWVADFRDPLTYESRFHSKIQSVYNRQRRTERYTVENADAITTLTSAHPLILADQYGAQNTKHVHFIPTGLDKKLLPEQLHTSSEAYLIFIGEFLSQYGGEFFEIFKKSGDIKLKVVGYKEVNSHRMAPFIKGLESRIEFIDHLPQQEVYKLVQASTAAVICTARNYPWWVSFAKVVDYIALRKPVVAIVPDPSEARKWLQKTGLGVFLDGSVEDSANKLKEFINNPKVEIKEEHCKMFESSFQVKEFEKVFLSCLK